MKMKYISQIQFNLKRYKAIHTNRATTCLLDGSYNSVYKGRSMNFDELREYVPGDDIKDIDWKASARGQKLLVKQYIAEKKHNIMLIVETNRRMLADTKEGQEKREVALMCAGTMAYLANQNGDYVSSIYSTEKSIQYFPFKTGLTNIENILTNYQKDVTKGNISSLEKSIDYLIHNIRRRMIIVIITDMEGTVEVPDTMLKRLLVMNDVLLIQVGDADMTGKKIFNLEGDQYIVPFLSEDKKLAKLEAQRRQEIYMKCMDKLKKYGIVSTTVNHTKEMDTQIMEMLNRHKMEKR